MRHSLALGARTHAGASQRRRTLKIDVDGRVDGATQIPSPNCDARPPETAVSLIVVHGISLPPGRFGGDAIERLFTNRLDPGGAPVFRDDRRPARLVALPDSARRRAAAVRAVRRARLARRRVGLARPIARATTFRSASSSKAPTTRPTPAAQYTMLVAACAGAAPRAIRIDEVVGHSDVAPGRKTDPGPRSTGRRAAARRAGAAAPSAMAAGSRFGRYN